MSYSNTTLAGLTILVVDDEPDNVVVMVKLLSRLGANAVSVENGKAGLSAARSFRPELILCDLSMPVMSGWEMLHEMQEDPELKHIPVIALTAHAMAGDKERVLRAGFANYIPKPIDVPKFIPMFIEMLQAIPQLKRAVHKQNGDLN